jgi:hypothetical protein
MPSYRLTPTPTMLEPSDQFSSAGNARRGEHRSLCAKGESRRCREGSVAQNPQRVDHAGASLSPAIVRLALVGRTDLPTHGVPQQNEVRNTEHQRSERLPASLEKGHALVVDLDKAWIGQFDLSHTFVQSDLSRGAQCHAAVNRLEATDVPHHDLKSR